MNYWIAKNLHLKDKQFGERVSVFVYNELGILKGRRDSYEHWSQVSKTLTENLPLFLLLIFEGWT